MRPRPKKRQTIKLLIKNNIINLTNNDITRRKSLTITIQRKDLANTLVERTVKHGLDRDVFRNVFNQENVTKTVWVNWGPLRPSPILSQDAEPSLRSRNSKLGDQPTIYCCKSPTITVSSVSHNREWKLYRTMTSSRWGEWRHTQVSQSTRIGAMQI